MQVLDRINKTLLVAAGATPKTTDTLKAKLASLDLPERDSSLPESSMYLLSLADEVEDDSNGEPKEKKRRLAA